MSGRTCNDVLWDVDDVGRLAELRGIVVLILSGEKGEEIDTYCSHSSPTAITVTLNKIKETICGATVYKPTLYIKT